MNMSQTSTLFIHCIYWSWCKNAQIRKIYLIRLMLIALILSLSNKHRYIYWWYLGYSLLLFSYLLMIVLINVYFCIVGIFYIRSCTVASVDMSRTEHSHAFTSQNVPVRWVIMADPYHWGGGVFQFNQFSALPSPLQTRSKTRLF